MPWHWCQNTDRCCVVPVPHAIAITTISMDLVLMLHAENWQTSCLWLACWHPYDVHSRFLELFVSVQNSVMLEPALCRTASWIHAAYTWLMFCIQNHIICSDTCCHDCLWAAVNCNKQNALLLFTFFMFSIKVNIQNPFCTWQCRYGQSTPYQLCLSPYWLSVWGQWWFLQP